jgi:Fe-S-cluster containining protein
MSRTLPILPSAPESVGTYQFCSGCPAHLNCCSRVRPGGPIDTPLLLAQEVAAISEMTGLSPSTFSIGPTGQNSATSRMKTGTRGCIFFDGQRCTVYKARPLDCRLFPLDIVLGKDGRLRWIAYTQLCPVEASMDRYLQQAELLLPQLLPVIVEYARCRPVGMERQAFVELKVIDGPGSL